MIMDEFLKAILYNEINIGFEGEDYGKENSYKG